MSHVPMPYDELSAYLDQELPEPQLSEVQECLGEYFSALLDVRNMEILSRACKNLSQTAPTADFESALRVRLDKLGWMQDDPAEDFETLSAWSDGVFEPSTLQMTPVSEIHLSNIRLLSKALQQLPLPGEIPAGFPSRVMAALSLQQEAEAAPGQDWLYQALQALPIPEAPEDFLLRLEARLDQVDTVERHNQAVLVQALQGLPQPSASADFMERLLQRIESLEQEPDFAMLSAYADQALALSAAVCAQSEVQTQLHNIRVLAAAVNALPVPEASPDFLVRLEARLSQQADSVRKYKIFALPMTLRTRFLRMVAGIAIFGLLVSFSQHMLDTQMSSPQEVGTAAVIPTDRVIYVENQPEDALFTELDVSLDEVSDENYNQFIGG